MQIIPDLDDDRAAQDDEDHALEAETALLRVLLGAVCHARSARAVMAALSLTLQAVVAEVSCDLQGIEEFNQLFAAALRVRWVLQEQEREQAGAQAATRDAQDGVH